MLILMSQKRGKQTKIKGAGNILNQIQVPIRMEYILRSVKQIIATAIIGQACGLIRIGHQNRGSGFGNPVKSRAAMQRLMDIADKVNQEAERVWPADFARRRLGCFKDCDTALDCVYYIALAGDKACRFRKRTRPERQVDEMPVRIIWKLPVKSISILRSRPIRVRVRPNVVCPGRCARQVALPTLTQERLYLASRLSTNQLLGQSRNRPMSFRAPAKKDLDGSANHY